MGDVKYTCNNGSWTSSGNCVKVCSGGPSNTIANSTIISGSGTMYNSNGTVASFNANSVDSYYYANGYIIQSDCSNGYYEVDNNDNVNTNGSYYKCENGSWKSYGSCKVGCNEASPVFDADNLKVADKMYGITFANNGTNSGMHTYNVCYKNSNTNTLFTLNPNGTGLGSVKPNDHVNCSFNEPNNFYMGDGGRTLVCKINNSINNGKPYWWQSKIKSCDLNELKNNYPGINIQLAYGGYGANYVKDINTIMISGSKQIRFFCSGDEWSRPYISFKENANEGSSASRNLVLTCNSNGNWDVTASGYVEYNYTGTPQTFTPTKYGIPNGKVLTLEVWGASGSSVSNNTGGKGGYTYGKYISNSNNLYVYVGGTGSGSKGGWNGGGSSPVSTDGAGGGGTDIRTTQNDNYLNRIIVAGGGGGASTGSDNAEFGGAGGGGNNPGGNAGAGCDGVCYTPGQGGGLNGCNILGASSFMGGGGYYAGGWCLWGDINEPVHLQNTCNLNYPVEKAACGGGGGGSGFCGNGATNCSGQNGVRSGNGYAKISW